MEPEKEYYDILIIGKAGWGKKTLLNKLVGVDDENLKRSEWSEETNGCKLSFLIVSNIKSQPIRRVTIVPGFGDINIGAANSANDGNTRLSLHTLHRMQGDLNMSFKRVVYFLPFRGPPERVDCYFRNELTSLWDFYGEKIFQCMVMIATNSSDEEYQAIGFSEAKKQTSMTVVSHVLSEVTKSPGLKCPPIAYLPLTCSPEVALDILKLKCATDGDPLKPSDAKKCVKCCSCEYSKCHPDIIMPMLPLPRELTLRCVSNIKKCFSHVPRAEQCPVLSSIHAAAVHADNYYKCMQCKKTSGNEGCMKIGENFNNGDKTIIVEHKY